MSVMPHKIMQESVSITHGMVRLHGCGCIATHPMHSFSSNSSPTAVRNYGTSKNGRYMQISNNGSIQTNDKSTNVSTSISNSTRLFYFNAKGSNPDYYLYYAEGLDTSDSSNGSNRGWYLREMKKVLSSDGLQFNDSGVQNFSHLTHELKFIDDYGAPIVLDKICRNELLDIHLNVFHSESSGQLYFEVDAWRVPENGADKETTFD